MEIAYVVNILFIYKAEIFYLNTDYHLFRLICIHISLGWISFIYCYHTSVFFPFHSAYWELSKDGVQQFVISPALPPNNKGSSCASLEKHHCIRPQALMQMSLSDKTSYQ